MKDKIIDPTTRRGLLLMAAAAGASLAVPRFTFGAGDKGGNAKFGGDLSAVRTVIENNDLRPSKDCRTGSHCPRLPLKTATCSRDAS